MNNKRSVRQIRGGQALAGKNRCDIQYMWAEPRDDELGQLPGTYMGGLLSINC